MKASPSFQLYAQDFVVGVADMTAEEVGGYIRLLCYQWVKGGLPNDQIKLSQLSGLPSGLSLGNVLAKFGLSAGNVLINDKLERVRESQNKFHDKQRENGLKGGNPNFEKGKPNPYHNPLHNPKDKPEDNPEITLSSSSSSSSSNPNSNTEESIESPKNERQSHFMKEVGSLYRRRESTPWAKGELKALREVMARPDADSELVQLVDYYVRRGKTPDGKWLKQDVSALLNDWTGQLDKSVTWKPERSFQKRPVFNAIDGTVS